MNLTVNDCKELVREINHNHGDKLTDWELRFLINITDYMLHGGFLTTRQKQKLQQIYERVTDI